MPYTDHKNISIEEHLEIGAQLKKVESQVTPFMRRNGFEVASKKQEILDISYEVFNEYKYDYCIGGIGLWFDDIKSRRTFTITMLKAYDIGKKRFYKRESLFKNIELTDIKKDPLSFFKNGLDVFKSWRREDLKEYIESN